MPDRGGPRPRVAGRLVHALPVLAFLATFGVFFVDKSREARTVLRSGRGLLTVAAIVVGYVVVAWAVRRVSRWPWLPPVVLTGVVLGLAAWVVRPYYDDETTNRRLLADPVADTTTTTGGPESTTDGTAAPTTAAGPVRASRGELRGFDHDASGTASVLRAPDGAVVVRFEDFAIEGTPDPRVYLVEGEDVRSPGGVELGPLGGTTGDVLDYAVPTGSEAGPGWTVLVWCRSFSVPIANATQRAP